MLFPLAVGLFMIESVARVLILNLPVKASPVLSSWLGDASGFLFLEAFPFFISPLLLFSS